jgi:hypothetical protein
MLPLGEMYSSNAKIPLGEHIGSQDGGSSFVFSHSNCCC